MVRQSKAVGNTSYDIPGALTVTAGLVALVYGFTKAASDGWASTATLAFLGLAVVLLAAFVTIEIRVPASSAKKVSTERVRWDRRGT